MKKILKNLLPESLFLSYHRVIAMLAAVYYRYPGKKMIVIGITGTKGKTSTANFIWSCLSAGGFKTGIISTANIRIGQEESLNTYHMTMPGRFTIQKLMAQMVKEGCTYCVVETTSEGLKQYRHTGVYYDIGVFTNLSPEHLPSHGGSFQKYKETKGRMFASLTQYAKVINGQKIDKIIIANKDNEHADYFLSFPADKKLTFSIQGVADCVAQEIEEFPDGVRFNVGEDKFRIDILGKFNVYNALPAIIISKIAGISSTKIAEGLTSLSVIPGRMEEINAGQNFSVIVDYAHEKESVTNVLKTARAISKNSGKTIILLGAEGGGRDKAKRPIMGELTGKMADYVIVSNVDPYEDDPKEILEDIARSAEQFSKVRDKDLFVIEDRRLGIRKALSLASDSDIVLITGKGAEQSITIDGKTIPWDDRQVVREELGSLLLAKHKTDDTVSPRNLHS